MSVSSTKEAVYTFEGFRIDGSKRIIFSPEGRVLSLMPKAFDILFYLVSNSGRAVDKDELMSAVWPDTIVEENNLTQNISAIRRALGEKHGDNRFIATLPGRGYKFVAEAKSESDVVREDQQKFDTHSERRRSGRFWLAFGLIVLIGLIVAGIVRWDAYTSQTAAPIRSMAVLPFKPITIENRDEALELGMADALITKLSDGEDLNVRPLTSVRRFSSPEQDPLQAGRQLGVEAVLDGGIQISGGRVRISVRLVRVSDGRQIWSGQFDELSSDIFQVQDSISDKVASALKVRLRNENRKPYTANIEAYQLFLKGKFHAYKFILPEVQQGISYYQQAIAADPAFALAYVELANAYRAMVLTNDAPPLEMMPKSQAAAERAIELDDSLAEAWTAVAFTTFWYQWNWALAEEQFRKALELDPGSAQTHAFYAHLLSNIGRHEEAIAEIKRAREIDQLDLLYDAIEGQILFFAGRSQESITALETATMVGPDFWLAHLFLSRVYIQDRMWPEAIASASKAKDIASGNSEAVGALAIALARSGRREEALNELRELEKRSGSRYVPPYVLAQIYLAVGDRDRALEQLADAYQRKDTLMVFLKVDPKWDELRSEPRFVDLMRKMRFE